MTKDEAIRELKTRYLTMSQCLGKEELHKSNEALDMAIKALEQESSDCISRKEALKALGEAPYVWTDCDAELQAYEDWRTIKEMLEGLPSVAPKESKWIPVSEGLPENNMACLVTVGELNLVQIAMYSDLMETINHRIFYQGTYGKDDFRDITQYVKAWQPLPEPYKKESEE